MKLNLVFLFMLIIGVTLIGGCLTQPGSGTGQSTPEGAAALAPTIVYKTRGDYYNFVPVGLSKTDKNVISSYPHPSDVYYKGKLAYPTILNNGYLLDNRGVFNRSAFLDITYEEYTKLDLDRITHDFLKNHILDTEPFTELYDCGPRYSTDQEVVDNINRIIDENNLNTNCERLV